MQKVMPALLLAGWLLVNCSAIPAKDKQLWQTWDEVVKGAAATNKPILVDIYTDWCRYCKIMDAKTYRHDSVSSYLKENFYRYKFNAEMKDTLRWNNKTFAFNPRYDVHDFAVYLTRGSIVYPTTVIILPTGQPYFQHGELKPGDMEMILRYFTENRGSKTLEQFAASFKPTWK